MSTAGILRAPNVVFYHPLDNFVESAVGQTWTGSGGFVGGKIGLSNSAVTADAAAWTPATTVDASGAVQSSAQIVIGLDSTRAVLAYNRIRAGIHTAVARVATLSSGTVTLGSEAVLGVGSVVGHPTGAALGGGKLLLHWQTNRGARTTSLIVGTVTGADISLGAANTSVTPANGGGGIAVLTSTRCILVHGMSTEHDGGVFSRVVDISGTDITVGAASQVAASGGPGFAVGLDSTRAAAVWVELGTVRSAILTASGAVVTVGATVFVDPDNGTRGVPSIVGLSSNKVAYVWLNSPITLYRARVGAVAGNAISLGAITEIVSGYTANPIGAVALSSTAFVAMQAGRKSRIGTVSGLTVTFGGASSAPTAQSGGGVGSLSATTFMHMSGRSGTSGGPVDVAAGVLSQEASMTAPTPMSYPDATGNDRLVVAMWAKNLAPSGSTVTVQRDFVVALAATAITLGPDTATWDGAGVAAVMSSSPGGMNDGSSHLLVMDFEHAGGGTWTLRTSVDGAAFTSQGLQTSGTRDTVPAALTPGLSIDSGGVGQWIDELVMWSGDKSSFMIFEAQELANLFDLADTFGEPMDQFEENFGAPLCWQATARMPDGRVWRDSGSGPCPATVRVPRGANDIVVTDDGCRVSPRIQE